MTVTEPSTDTPPTPHAPTQQGRTWWGPSARLSEVSRGRDNNFNLIRALAATLVLVTHSFVLVADDMAEEPLLRQLNITLGTIAVDIFFVTSGFLIAASLRNRNNIAGFAIARIRRIYPAVIFMSLATVFVLGPAITTAPVLTYLTEPLTYTYFLRTSLIVDGVGINLPGVFADNPFPDVVNGSLWTLPIEIRAYAIILTLWIVTRAVKHVVDKDVFGPLLVLFGSVGLLGFLSGTSLPMVLDQDSRLYVMFFIGASCFVLQRHIVLHTKVFLALAMLLLFASQDADAFHLVYGASIAYFVFFLGHIPRGAVRAFNRVGDYSYGLYIFAFPVQQTLVATFPSISVLEMIGTSFIITLALAALSWHFVEKPALRR